ncbi:hypothetical protein D9619_011789 [Psilocybe cf. subviscida]|uniref:Thiolase C-terminal domain-containing protein n=1 Tax=Psilocybe cf. subviscida TaxID=2480587 RepID=A0A8H5B1E2_9AGAR|nr:hypothetical protein D9619_011789 [Psilocybe cf. subviscida]
MFDNGAQEYLMKYGGNIEHLAKIAPHQTVLPPAQYNYGLGNQAIEIVAQALTTDGTTFEGRSAMDVVGHVMSKWAADKAFKDAGFSEGQGRDLVGVVELHDCFASNEVKPNLIQSHIHTHLFLVARHLPYAGLCKKDEAHTLVERGDNTYGGKYVGNSSGGLKAKCHSLGATGIGMHFYIMMQLREWAGPMQASRLFDIPDKRGKFGLIHNVGLGGAVVVSLLHRSEFYKPGRKYGRDGLGYNHAHECRLVTMADVDKVMSKTASRYVLQ